MENEDEKILTYCMLPRPPQRKEGGVSHQNRVFLEAGELSRTTIFSFLLYRGIHLQGLPPDLALMQKMHHPSKDTAPRH